MTALASAQESKATAIDFFRDRLTSSFVPTHVVLPAGTIGFGSACLAEGAARARGTKDERRHRAEAIMVVKCISFDAKYDKVQ